MKYQTQLHGHQWGSDQSTCHAKVQKSLLLYIRVMSFYMGCDCGCSDGRIESVLSVEQHVISVMYRCTPCPQRPPAQMLHLPPLTACAQLPDRGLSQRTLPPLLLITHDRIPNNRLCAASAQAAMFIAPDTWLPLSLGLISRRLFALLLFVYHWDLCITPHPHPQKSQIPPWLKVCNLNQIPPSSAISLTW